jgi:PIN domain nuclease of toxin-antitoxin system
VSALLLDTCAVIYVGNGEPIDPHAVTVLAKAESGDGVLVSPVSAWEIGLMGRAAWRRTPQFLPDPKTWMWRFLEQPGVRVADLTPDITIDSSFLPEGMNSDPADRPLVATARALNVPIMTRDAAILSFAAAGHLRAIGC